MIYTRDASNTPGRLYEANFLAPSSPDVPREKEFASLFMVGEFCIRALLLQRYSSRFIARARADGIYALHSSFIIISIRARFDVKGGFASRETDLSPSQAYHGDRAYYAQLRNIIIHRRIIYRLQNSSGS